MPCLPRVHFLNGVASWLQTLFLDVQPLHNQCCLALVTSFSAVCVFRLLYFWLRWVFILLHAGFSSCDARAYLPHGMWDIPGPGIEPTSPALEGGFLTTEPPGKLSVSLVFNSAYLQLGLLSCYLDTQTYPLGMLFPQTGFTSISWKLAMCPVLYIINCPTKSSNNTAYSHFIDEDTEAQRGYVTCSGSHSQHMVKTDRTLYLSSTACTLGQSAILPLRNSIWEL